MRRSAIFVHVVRTRRHINSGALSVYCVCVGTLTAKIKPRCWFCIHWFHLIVSRTFRAASSATFHLPLSFPQPISLNITRGRCMRGISTTTVHWKMSLYLCKGLAGGNPIIDRRWVDSIKNCVDVQFYEKFWWRGLVVIVVLHHEHFCGLLQIM